MSAQFISRNPLFFCKRLGRERKKNHTSNKNVGKELQIKYEKNYKNLRSFMIKNCFSYNKASLPFKKIFTKLKSIFYVFCTRQRQHFTKNT